MEDCVSVISSVLFMIYRQFMLSQAMTWISNVMCRGLFVFSEFSYGRRFVAIGVGGINYHLSFHNLIPLVNWTIYICFHAINIVFSSLLDCILEPFRQRCIVFHFTNLFLTDLSTVFICILQWKTSSLLNINIRYQSHH